MRRRPSTVAEAIALGRTILEQDRSKAAPFLAAMESRRALDPGILRRLSGAPLVDLLRTISYGFRFEDPAKMVRFAIAACKVADGLSNRRYGKEIAADLRAEAWTELANAYRVAGSFNEAGTALSQARDLMGRGSLSPALLARFAEVLGKYLVDLRRLGEAEVELESAAELYAELGLQEESVRARLGLAHLLVQSYEPERAAVTYLRVLSGLEPGSPHRLTATHGLILNLVDAGHPALAEQLLQRNRRLYRRSGRLNQYRLFWLEGKIAKGLGQFGAAEAKLNLARLAFLRVDQVYDSALVSLDLAWVYARQRRHRETIWLVESLLGTFRTLGIAREALASLTLLKKSCEQQQSADSLCGQIEVLGRVLPELRPRRNPAGRPA